GPASIRDDVRRLLDQPQEGDAPGLRARLLGGFRFNPHVAMQEPWEAFGAGWLALPRVLFVLDGEAAGVVIAPGVEPADAARAAEVCLGRVDATNGATLQVERPMNRGRWLESVGQIAAQVREGVYEKAVLASTQRLVAD